MENQRNWRTDLAIDIQETLEGTEGFQTIPGVSKTVEETPVGDIIRLEVKDLQAAQIMHKAPGTYVTIEAPCLGLREKEKQNQVAMHWQRRSRSILHLPQDAVILVIGLGNASYTGLVRTACC